MAVHWMLIELGVPFEARLVDFATKAHKSTEYLRLNPDGMIPTLVVDGKPHFESAALALMLAERHPEGGLEIPRGAPERPDYLQWMLHFANTLQPLYRAWFYTDEVGGAESAEAVRAHARAGIEKVWGVSTRGFGQCRTSRAGVSAPSIFTRPCSYAGRGKCRKPPTGGTP
jgi:glutathione S-transferase